MTSKFVEIVPLSDRQGNVISFAGIRALLTAWSFSRTPDLADFELEKIVVSVRELPLDEYDAENGEFGHRFLPRSR